MAIPKALNIQHKTLSCCDATQVRWFTRHFLRCRHSLFDPSTGSFNKLISCDPEKSFSHSWCSFHPPPIPFCLLLPHLHACSPCPQCSPGPFAINFMFSIQSLSVLSFPIPTLYGDLRATAQTGQDRFGPGAPRKDLSRTKAGLTPEHVFSIRVIKEYARYVMYVMLKTGKPSTCVAT